MTLMTLSLSIPLEEGTAGDKRRLLEQLRGKIVLQGKQVAVAH